MAQYNAKPESVLKRAEELVSLGYKQKALETLHAVVANRRHRLWSKATENMTLRFIELCVELRKSDLAKEGLFQYRITSLQVPNSLETVIKHFLACAREEADRAQQKAAAAGAALDMDDLDVTEDSYADQLLLVSGEGSKERSERIVDREIVIPWLKFQWETYRTVLDTLRYMTKLEQLYKSTAEQAFQFCQAHKRVTEFRRLNELLKSHLLFLKTNSSAPLDNPETFQTQLEIRLKQLNTAAAMEQWQEAFKTVEEINGMVAPPKRTPPIEMMIIYYEKLAKIFWVSENYIFHAHAIAKYHQLLAELSAAPAVVGGKATASGNVVKSLVASGAANGPELATQVFLAALSMPVAPGVVNHRSVALKSTRQHVPLSVAQALEKQQSLNIEVATDHLLSEQESNLAERVARASQMYGFGDLEADRDVMLRDFIAREQLTQVMPEFADLYTLLEVKFQPLKLGALLQAKLKALEEVPALKGYTKTLTQLSFLRIIQQLGTVYQTLRLSRLFELVPFLTPELVERWTLKAIRERYIEARLDHKHGYIVFQSSLQGAQNAVSQNTTQSAGTCSSFESQRLRHTLVRVAQILALASTVVLTPHREARAAQKKAALTAAAAELESERARILKRRELIERTNLERERRHVAAVKERQARDKAAREKAAQDEKERQEAKAKAAKDKVEAVKVAEAEDQKKQALMDKLSEQAAKQRTKLDSRATAKLKSGSMDTQEFIDSTVKQLVQTQQRAENKLRELVDRADHLARAKRASELELMQAATVERTKRETAQLEAVREKKLADAKTVYERMVADKQRVAKFATARKAFEAQILEERRQLWVKTEADRKNRDEAIAAKRREEAEELRRKQEADEQRRAQDVARKAAETKARQEREAVEREKAAAAEAAAAEKAASAAANDKGDEPKLNWAQRRALEAGGSLQRGPGGVSGPPAPSGGSYRPPGARSNTDSGNDGGDDDGWRRKGTSTSSQGGQGSRYGSGSGSGSGSQSQGSGSSSGAYRPPNSRGGGGGGGGGGRW